MLYCYSNAIILRHSRYDVVAGKLSNGLIIQNQNYICSLGGYSMTERLTIIQ